MVMCVDYVGLLSCSFFVAFYKGLALFVVFVFGTRYSFNHFGGVCVVLTLFTLTEMLANRHCVAARGRLIGPGLVPVVIVGDEGLDVLELLVEVVVLFLCVQGASSLVFLEFLEDF